MKETRLPLLLVLSLLPFRLAWVPLYTTWPSRRRRRHRHTPTSGSTSGSTNRLVLNGTPTTTDVSFFGSVYRLGGSRTGSRTGTETGSSDSDSDRTDQDRSFVNHMGVPTFAVNASQSTTQPEVTLDLTTTTTTAQILHAVQPGPAIVIRNVLARQDCQNIIQTCEKHLGFQDFCAGKNNHGALQIVVSDDIVDALTLRLAPHVDVAAVQALAKEMENVGSTNAGGNSPTTITTSKTSTTSLRMVSLNRRWRVYRYAPGSVQSFAPHIDAAFPPSGLTRDGLDLMWDTSSGRVVSRLTVLLYLNDDFGGGETVFYQPSNHPSEVLEAVRPITGSVLLFPQAVGEEAVDYARRAWPLHEGSPVTQGPSPKYVIRSDVMFTTSDDNGQMS